MNLMNATIGKEYFIKTIGIEDEELSSFLFSLGCYSGEPITVIQRRKRNCTVAMKNARYCMDNELAAAIVLDGGLK